MIPTTQAVRDNFMASHHQVMRITMGNTVITDADIIAGGFVIDSYSVSGDRIEIGSAIASELSLHLDNFDGRFSNTVFEGQELAVELGVKDWETDDPVVYIPMGYFTCDKQPKNRSDIEIKALDRMTKFDVPVDWSIFTFPCTLQEMVTATCTEVDVWMESNFSSLTNASYQIDYSPETTATYRDIIRWAAFLTATCARINENGNLVFRGYSWTGLEINASNRYSHELEEDDITITGVYYNGSGVEYLAGTADYALEFSNCDILQNNIEIAIRRISQVMNGFTYRPFEAVIQSAPFLQPMDIIDFVDRDGVSHDCIITHMTYTGNQSTPIKGIGATSTEASYAGLTGLTAQQTVAVDDAKRQATNYLSSDQTGIMVANMTDGKRYTPSNVPTGVKNTFIDNDSFDIRDGQTTLASFGATSSQIGQSSGSNKNVVVNADGMKVRSGTTELATFEELRAQIGKSSGGHLIIGSDTVLGNYLRMMAGQKILLDLNDEYMEAGNNNKGVRIDYGAGVDPMIGVSVNQSIPVSMSYNSSSGKGEIVSDYGQFGSLNVEGSVDMSGNLTIYRSGAPSVKVGNDVADIQLLCATNGNRGIYDPNLQKWLMRFDAEGIAYITSPINTSLVIDRSPSEDATSASIKITAGAGAGYAGASIGLYASTGATKGLYSYDTANGGGNEWIVWYDETDDAVYLNDKYCKRTVHSNTSTLYSETIKYSNGRLITNMRATISAACTTSGFGGYYNSSSIGVPAFPVAYANGTIPTVMTTVRHINGQAIYALLAQNVTSRTNPGGVYVLRSTSGTGDLEVDIHAEGMWK